MEKHLWELWTVLAICAISWCFDRLYRIAGNFHMVQNFAFFADRLGAVKIRTAKYAIYTHLDSCSLT